MRAAVAELAGPDRVQTAILVALREAGGFVTDYRGRSQPVHHEQVLAGNDGLHSKMHKVVANALR